ncbi:hypothetical protein THRCLA_21021 [Thraustotheca clavata]|uniref:RNase H type-1 domain-containing protein n=1 Tax=Thraustotheca clavata TaxID=74557 RepID=A0A1W0A0Z7_9STRA|nr:hypothetical protein THRCLA_21021 [Thraustotheca clavata]
MTNNKAEYDGLLSCLLMASHINCTQITIHEDSQLILNQLMGTKIKVLGSPSKFKITWRHIPREVNNAADMLSKLTQDNRKSYYFSEEEKDKRLGITQESDFLTLLHEDVLETSIFSCYEQRYTTKAMDDTAMNRSFTLSKSKLLLASN